MVKYTSFPLVRGNFQRVLCSISLCDYVSPDSIVASVSSLTGGGSVLSWILPETLKSSLTTSSTRRDSMQTVVSAPSVCRQGSFVNKLSRFVCVIQTTKNRNMQYLSPLLYSIFSNSLSPFLTAPASWSLNPSSLLPSSFPSFPLLSRDCESFGAENHG